MDVDFLLYQDGVYVNGSLTVRRDDQLFYLLSAGKSYRLKLKFVFPIYWTVLESNQKQRYYNWGGAARVPCDTFQLELAIGPLPQAWTASCKESLPDGREIKISNDPVNFRKSYEFSQTVDPFSSKIQFNIEKQADVRVLATYNFLQADLALTITNNASGTVLMYGDSGSNYENLGPIRLQPGRYDLTIFEPLRLPTGLYKLTTTLGFFKLTSS